MKRKGFTIAEILVALTLIGIIAVLTMAALNTSVQKSQVGPALTKALATLDNANAIMMQEQDMYSFSIGCTGTPFAYDQYINRCFEPHIRQVIGAAPVTYDTAGLTYSRYPGLAVAAITFNSNNSKAYKMKSGSTYIFSGLAANTGKLSSYQRVYVDINGDEKGPNTVGKDLFLLVMSLNDGKMYAYGSAFLLDNDGEAVERIPQWNDGNSCNANDIRDDLTCAGSVIDNNGKVIYKDAAGSSSGSLGGRLSDAAGIRASAPISRAPREAEERVSQPASERKK